jgi:hypothetical protein
MSKGVVVEAYMETLAGIICQTGIKKEGLPNR